MLYSSTNNIKAPEYISEPIFYKEILPYFNKMEFANAYADKSLYNKVLPSIKQPHVIIKKVSGIYFDLEDNVLTSDQVSNLIKKQNKIIVKPTIDSGSGKGIRVLEKEDIDFLTEIDQVFMDNYIIQEFLIQHEDLSELNQVLLIQLG